MVSPNSDRPERIHHGYDEETFIDYEEWLPEFDELDDPLIDFNFEREQSDDEVDEFEANQFLPSWYPGD